MQISAKRFFLGCVCEYELPYCRECEHQAGALAFALGFAAQV